MKYFFASDLHGSASACEAVLNHYAKENADRLILLGDLLYHGPRNPLPDQYNPKAVIGMLSAFSPAPLCVRGNCDSEVDQMVLPFPIMADYSLLALEGSRVAFLTHGHLFHIGNPPPLKQGDLLIHGHTHIHCVNPQGEYVYVNPGSASLPKEGQPKSYMIYENGLFSIRDFEGNTLLEYAIEN